MILIAVALLHAALLLLLLRQAGVVTALPQQPVLAIFDVAPPPLPPPPPVPTRRIADRSAGGAPPAAMPVRAHAPVVAPVHRLASFDATIDPVAAPAPLPLVAALPGLPLDGGDAGTGTGNGGGNGEGAGQGAARPGYARARWLAQPSVAEWRRHFPIEALRQKISGWAILACEVPRSGQPRSCKVIGEAPIGHGFGLAATAMSPLFRVRPVYRDQEPLARIPIIVPVVFEVRGAPLPPMPHCPPPYCMSDAQVRQADAAP